MASSIVCTKDEEHDDLDEDDNYGIAQVCDFLGGPCENWTGRKKSANYRFSEPCKHLGASLSGELSVADRKPRKKKQKYFLRCDGSEASKPSVIESSASDASTADGCNVDNPAGCNSDGLGVGCMAGRSSEAIRFQEDQQRKQRIRELSHANRSLRERMQQLEDGTGRLHPSASLDPSRSDGRVVQAISDLDDVSRTLEQASKGSGRSDKSLMDNMDNGDEDHEDVPTLLYRLHTMEIVNQDLQEEMGALKRVVEGQRNVKQDLHDVRERYKSLKSRSKEMEAELLELRESLVRCTGENDFLSKKLTFLEKRKSEEVKLSDLINRDTATRAIILDLKHEIHDLKCEVAVERILKQRFKGELKRASGDDADEGASSTTRSLFQSEDEIRDEIMTEKQKLRYEHMFIARKFQTNLNAIADYYWREESLLRYEIDSLQTFMHERGMEPFELIESLTDKEQFESSLDQVESRKIVVNPRLEIVGFKATSQGTGVETEELSGVAFSCKSGLWPGGQPVLEPIDEFCENSPVADVVKKSEKRVFHTNGDESEEEETYGPIAPSAQNPIQSTEFPAQHSSTQSRALKFSSTHPTDRDTSNKPEEFPARRLSTKSSAPKSSSTHPVDGDTSNQSEESPAQHASTQSLAQKDSDTSIQSEESPAQHSSTQSLAQCTNSTHPVDSNTSNQSEESPAHHSSTQSLAPESNSAHPVNQDTLNQSEVSPALHSLAQSLAPKSNSARDESEESPTQSSLAQSFAPHFNSADPADRDTCDDSGSEVATGEQKRELLWQNEIQDEKKESEDASPAKPILLLSRETSSGGSGDVDGCVNETARRSGNDSSFDSCRATIESLSAMVPSGSVTEIEGDGEHNAVSAESGSIASESISSGDDALPSDALPSSVSSSQLSAEHGDTLSAEHGTLPLRTEAIAEKDRSDTPTGDRLDENDDDTIPESNGLEPTATRKESKDDNEEAQTDTEPDRQTDGNESEADSAEDFPRRMALDDDDDRSTSSSGDRVEEAFGNNDTSQQESHKNIIDPSTEKKPEKRMFSLFGIKFRQPNDEKTKTIQPEDPTVEEIPRPVDTLGSVTETRDATEQERGSVIVAAQSGSSDPDNGEQGVEQSHTQEVHKVLEVEDSGEQPQSKELKGSLEIQEAGEDLHPQETSEAENSKCAEKFEIDSLQVGVPVIAGVPIVDGVAADVDDGGSEGDKDLTLSDRAVGQLECSGSPSQQNALESPDGDAPNPVAKKQDACTTEFGDNEVMENQNTIVRKSSTVSEGSVSVYSSEDGKGDISPERSGWVTSMDESRVLIALEDYVCSAIDVDDSQLASQASVTSENQESVVSGSVASEGQALNPIEPACRSAATIADPYSDQFDLLSAPFDMLKTMQTHMPSEQNQAGAAAERGLNGATVEGHLDGAPAEVDLATEVKEGADKANRSVSNENQYQQIEQIEDSSQKTDDLDLLDVPLMPPRDVPLMPPRDYIPSPRPLSTSPRDLLLFTNDEVRAQESNELAPPNIAEMSISERIKFFEQNVSSGLPNREETLREFWGVSTGGPNCNLPMPPAAQNDQSEEGDLPLGIIDEEGFPFNPPVSTLLKNDLALSFNEADRLPEKQDGPISPGRRNAEIALHPQQFGELSIVEQKDRVESPKLVDDNRAPLISTFESEVRAMASDFFVLKDSDSSDQESHLPMLPQREINADVIEMSESDATILLPNKFSPPECQDNGGPPKTSGLVRSLNADENEEAPYCGEIAEIEMVGTEASSSPRNVVGDHDAQTEQVDVASALEELSTRKKRGNEAVAALSPIMESECKDAISSQVSQPDSMVSPASAFLAYTRRQTEDGTDAAVADLVKLSEGGSPVPNVPSLAPSFGSSNPKELLILDTEYLKTTPPGQGTDKADSDASSWSTLSTTQDRMKEVKAKQKAKKENKARRRKLKRNFIDGRKTANKKSSERSAILSPTMAVKNRQRRNEGTRQEHARPEDEEEAIYEHDELNETMIIGTIGTAVTGDDSFKSTREGKVEPRILQDDVSELSQSMDGRAMYPRRGAPSGDASLESLPRFDGGRRPKEGDGDWVDAVVKGFASLWS